MPPNIEAIKHIGNIVDGKLVCVPDCPSITHKQELMKVNIEEKIANMPRITCKTCDGTGIDVGVDGYGEPEQIQCWDCHAEGTYTTLDCVRQALTSTRKEAFEEALAMLPEKKEYSDDKIDGDKQAIKYKNHNELGFNTAVALMRERLLGKIK